VADDITLNTMSGGSVVATDDSGTGHVQLVKLAYSADGSRVHIPADASGLLVNATGTVAVSAVSGTVAVIERGATIASGNASVTTSAAAVLSADATRRAAVLTNLGTDYVWIGDSGIAANEGIRLAPSQSLTIDRAPTPAIYAVANSGTQTVAYFTEAD
jgi:hypothetical protein